MRFAFVSHLVSDNLPGCQFVKFNRQLPDETALQISNRYHWSILKSLWPTWVKFPILAIKFTTDVCLHFCSNFPIGPEYSLDPVLLPLRYSKRCLKDNSFVCTGTVTVRDIL